MFWQTLHDSVVGLLHVERRFEPGFRATLDGLLREPSAALIRKRSGTTLLPSLSRR